MLSAIHFAGALATQYNGTTPFASLWRRRCMMHLKHHTTAFKLQETPSQPLNNFLCRLLHLSQYPPIPLPYLLKHHCNQRPPLDPYQPPPLPLPNLIPISLLENVLASFNSDALPVSEACHLAARLISEIHFPL